RCTAPGPPIDRKRRPYDAPPFPGGASGAGGKISRPDAPDAPDGAIRPVPGARTRSALAVRASQPHACRADARSAQSVSDLLCGRPVPRSDPHRGTFEAPRMVRRGPARSTADDSPAQSARLQMDSQHVAADAAAV